MNALLTYLAGSALMLVLLWTGFRLLFYAQKTLRVNRVLLTVILAFSVTAPLLLSPVRSGMRFQRYPCRPDKAGRKESGWSPC